MGVEVATRRRRSPTGWGWALLLGGASVSAVVPLMDMVAYRLLCANVIEWGANRANFCNGPLGDVLRGIGNTATIALSLAAAFGGLALGVSALRHARHDGASPSLAVRTLLVCAVVYTVALVCESGRMAIAGGSPISAMAFAPVSAGVLFAAWLAATGIALVIIGVVRENRVAAAEPR
ncbi:hypothetical protein [Microbacterium sp. bgisy203]|uniref:hypothetical protein n=1 Tax=Microbacterium sp. bgisy203 TaxID=3413799 RepID=UPI003D719002